MNIVKRVYLLQEAVEYLLKELSDSGTVDGGYGYVIECIEADGKIFVACSVHSDFFEIKKIVNTVDCLKYPVIDRTGVNFEYWYKFRFEIPLDESPFTDGVELNKKLLDTIQ